jgi:hypothetical protein
MHSPSVLKFVTKALHLYISASKIQSNVLAIKRHNFLNKSRPGGYCPVSRHHCVFCYALYKQFAPRESVSAQAPDIDNGTHAS